MSVEVHRPYSTNDTLVGYQDQPDGRGTLTILFSCVLTLTLCVWSAVHLDLPTPTESKWHYTLRYFKWSVMGLFGPEILIWIAWRQYISAWVLTQSVQEIDRTEMSTPATQHWTMVHSFYVGMGGYVFDLDDPDLADGVRFIPNLPRLHLTARGAQLLARCGLLPKMTKDEISDKSKTDAAGKLICCVQVIWVIISAITRLAVRLPVTPLEVNTIAHVVCALIIYGLWWHKPRWINEPTVLRGKWVAPLCAFMYMSSQVSAAHRSERDFLRNFGVKPELSDVLYIEHDSDEAHTSDASDVNGEAGVKEQAAETSISEKPSSTSESTTKRYNGRVLSRSHPGDTNATNEDPEHATQHAMQKARWQYCCEAIDKYPAIRLRLRYPERNPEHLRYRDALLLYPEMPDRIKRRFSGFESENSQKPTLPSEGWVLQSEELVHDHARDWPGDDLIRHMQGHLMGMVMWSSSTVYGAIHIAGWNEIFPTVIESWFWRGSALYVVFSGLLWSFLNWLGHVSGPVWIYWYDFLAENGKKKNYTWIYVSSTIGGTLYVVARIYLIVEAFISLRALPASAYTSPNWVLTVPHLG